MKDDYPFHFYDLFITVIWNDTTTWISVRRCYHSLMLGNPINAMENKQTRSSFIQCCGFKDFSNPLIVQKHMEDHPIARKKWNKMHQMKQMEREGRRKRWVGGEKGGKARKKQEMSVLMFPCSLMHPCASVAFVSLQLCWMQSTTDFQTLFLKILRAI